MSSWFEKGRPAILQGLAPIFDKIDADLRAELEERDREKHVSLLQQVDQMKARAADVENLEKENHSLKEELSELKKASEILPRPQDCTVSFGPDEQQNGVLTPRFSASARKPLGVRSPNKAQITPRPTPKSGAEASDVNWELEYQRLWLRHQKYAERLEETTAKAKVFREALKNWENYASSLEKKLGLKGSTGSSKSAARRDSSVAQPAQAPPKLQESTSTRELQAVAREGRCLPNVSFISNPDPDESVGVLDTAPEPGSQFRRASSTPAVTVRGHDSLRSRYPQPTEGGTELEPRSNTELPHLPQDDVLSDSVRVKREPSSDAPVVVSERCVGKRKHRGDGLTRPARRIKSESTGSSSPLIAATSVFFSPQESMDLDAGPRIQTPRKARRRTRDQLYAPQANNGADDEEENSEIIPVSPGIRGDGPEELLATPNARVATQDLGHSRATTSRAPRHQPSGEQGRRKLGRGIMSVTEDGPNPDEPHTESVLPYGGRLDALLNGAPPTLGNDPILVRPNRAARETPRPSHPWTLELSVPTRELPFEKSPLKNGRSTPKAATGGLNTPITSARRTASRLKSSSESAPSSKKVKGQLRKQPLSKLYLTDFKINPDFNEGLNFAFTEVVRGKAERAELPGCTDEHCCGKKFRDMALNERDAVGPSLIHQAANIKLLEDYLGDDAHRLATMNRLEKEDLWVEAKVRDLANRFGKHKHRYVRPSSPAALWNVDMPNTQEFAKEKEEMQKEVRKQVEERYRDAMRGNGRWLFRDE